jgi:hypothetical protein
VPCLEQSDKKGARFFLFFDARGIFAKAQAPHPNGWPNEIPIDFPGIRF